MYSENNTVSLDGMLAEALRQRMKRELSKLPDEKELEAEFPFTKLQEREERRLRRISRKKGRSKLSVYVGRAAVIILCVTGLSFGLLMTDDGIRAAVAEKLKTIAEKIAPMSYKADVDDVIKEHNEEKGYYEIAFDDVTVADREAAEAEFSLENVQVTYIPEGFEICEKRENEIRRLYGYINDNNNRLTVRIEVTGISDHTVDSERTTVEEITINGNDGMYFNFENENTGVIYWGNEIYTIHIYGHTSREELIKVAEGLKY